MALQKGKADKQRLLADLEARDATKHLRAGAPAAMVRFETLRHDQMAPLNRANQPMDDSDVGTSVYRWRCGSTVDGTDVDPNFLPSTCRGI